MHLTKLELQEMLREMGVKFSHTESYENLKKLFQEENHMRWMGKGRINEPRSGTRIKRVIRKKATAGAENMVVVTNPPVGRTDAMTASISIRKQTKSLNPREKNKKKHPPAKPAHTDSEFALRQKHDVIFDRSKNVFATVLRRSQNCCELCGHQYASEKDVSDHLKPFHIKPLASGGDVSVKNVVALCTECNRRLATDAQPSDIKQLKRKARGKIIRSVQIQRKPRY